MDLTVLVAGLGLGFSLIVAIGAQNVFVLRQGIRREHVLVVAAICAVSDAVLIAAGVGGMGAALQAAPWLVGVARWAGAAFLVGYGLLAARRAVRGGESGLRVDADEPGGRGAPKARLETPVPVAAGRGESVARLETSTDGVSRRRFAAPRPALLPVVLTCLALTWLNPHVYLDTVILLGSVGATHGDQRWVFAAGAMLASVAWFFSLAYGARLLGGVLASPRAWRVLDGIIAVVMVAIAVSLVLPA
ncbi:L-lysine exporter family protein LysE/ArgO [Agromyces flavus]|uniref:L-lysine exporter family protein LysE/ArgO n=1 Tax=Agromyces flavus TaxID=589382 RepID=A0A1H1XER2_9MICO|nr:LysE/ArgO family amino acid transporter [Agromyces flavus]MCP2366397.1 L-lysine exporter family protein LysE/ArgO [Agromyces flavus]GGI44594.1 lysine exporter protein [Agromyces flavus]SDT07728.1 L-lysine exporter family protein LysE/ArgO [Agromyces flavus]